MKKSIQNAVLSVHKTEDEYAKEEKKLETGPKLGNYFRHNPGEFDQLARAALDVAWSDAVRTDVLNLIIETKTLPAGVAEDLVEEDLRGLKARWQGKGGMIHSDIIRDEKFNITPDEISFALDYHQDEVRDNFWGTWDKLINKGREEMLRQPVVRLLDLLEGNVNDSTNQDQYVEVSRSTVQDSNIDPVIDAVGEESNGNVSIIGTRVGLAPFGKLATEWSDSLSDQYFRTGQVGVYKGYRLVQIENFEDFDGNKVLDPNDVWVVGENAGRLTYFGPETRFQTLAKENFFRRSEAARDAGLAVWGADRGRIGRIVWT